MRAANDVSSKGALRGSKRANFLNCMAVRHSTKQWSLYASSLVADPFRKEGCPSSSSNTVWLVKAMVSRSKRNSAPAAFVHANVTVANAPSQQKPADEQKLPSFTSRSRRSSGRFVSGEAAEPAKFLVTLL